MTDRDEQNRRYVNGLCADCGAEPYSAGRVRCAFCHSKHMSRQVMQEGRD